MLKYIILSFFLLASCSQKLVSEFEDLFKGEKLELPFDEADLHFGPGPEKRVEFGEKLDGEEV